MSVEIRLATAADTAEVTRLLGGFREYYAETEPSNATIEGVVAQLIDDRSCTYLLASPAIDAPPTGIAQLRFRLSVWTGSEDAWLEDLFVEPDSRGDGAGRALVEACIALARGRGCGRIQLDSNERNSRAIGLYRSLGFACGKPSRSEGGRDLYFTKEL